jgi:hypothetical protein
MACENCETDGSDVAAYPDVEVYDRYVTVQFHEKGEVLVLDEDGNVGRSWTDQGNTGLFPLGGAA